MKVTREMISAAHGVVLPTGIVIGWRLLERIYLAMRAVDPEWKEDRK